jgi:hypothetical protein
MAGEFVSLLTIITSPHDKFCKRERDREREKREPQVLRAKTISVVQFLIPNGAFGPSSNVVVVMQILVCS